MGPGFGRGRMMSGGCGMAGVEWVLVMDAINDWPLMSREGEGLVLPLLF